MPLPSQYLVTTKNLDAFFNAILTAQAPEHFTQKFLESLEFKSTNDRLYIGLLKALGFLDENGVPQDRYYRFLDQTQSKKVLAEAIREAYSDLFAIKTNANDLTLAEVKNKLRTLTQGKKTDDVLRFMSNTFRALADYADWKAEPKSKPEEPKAGKVPEIDASLQPPQGVTKDKEINHPALPVDFHYDIQIHLPDSRDQAVYDAIFKSLRDHLL